MGFLDFLTGTTNCPKCGTPGAKKEGNQVRCLNPTCEWFDQGLLQGMFGGPSPGATPPASGQNAGDFRSHNNVASAGNVAGSVTIRYRNFRGQDLTFVADPKSVVQKKNHVSVKALPTGQRVTLARARIQNLRELEAVVPQRVAPGQEWPTPRERQVLGYHMKYGTTSPLYEKIRAKYPNW
jgi:hypothetical protein